MEQVLKLAEDYMMQRVMSNHSPLTHTNKAVLILSIIAGLFGITASSFLLSGCFIWLLQNTHVHQAYMIFGFILAIVSFLIFAAVAYIQYKKAERAKAFKNQMRDEILLNLKLAQAELKDMEIIENNPKTCVVLATIIGFILQEKMM